MKKSFFGSLLILTVFLTGCSNIPAPSKSPAEMLKSAIEKNRTVLSSKSDGVFHLKVNTTENGKDKAFDANLKFTMGSDIRDAKKGTFVFDVDGDAKTSSSSDALAFTGTAAAINEAVFVKIDTLTGLGESFSDDLKKEILGQWWKIPLPPNALEDFIKEIQAAQSSQNQDEALKTFQWYNLFSNPAYLSDLSYRGVSDAKSGPSYRYTFKPSKEFFQSLKSSFRNETLPAAATDLKDADRFLDAVSADGEIWVSSDDEHVAKISVNMKADDVPDAKGRIADMRFDMDMETYDFDKAVEFDAPKDAKIFDLEALLGGFAASMQDPAAAAAVQPAHN